MYPLLQAEQTFADEQFSQFSMPQGVAEKKFKKAKALILLFSENKEKNK